MPCTNTMVKKIPSNIVHQQKWSDSKKNFMSNLKKKTILQGKFPSVRDTELQYLNCEKVTIQHRTLTKWPIFKKLTYFDSVIFKKWINPRYPVKNLGLESQKMLPSHISYHQYKIPCANISNVKKLPSNTNMVTKISWDLHFLYCTFF